MAYDQLSQFPHDRDLRGQPKSQQQLLHALELAADAVITLNPEGEVTYLNAAARRMLAEQGCPAEPILGKPLAGIWQASWLWQAILEASSRGRHNDFEHSEIASGRCYWVRTLSAPNSGLTVFAQDITERREWEARFRALTDEAPVAIGISRQGKLLYANPSYRRCFGMNEQEVLVGKSIFEQIAPEEHQRIREYVRQRYGGEPVAPSYEFTGIRADGSRFPAQVEVGQIQLPDGPASLAFITNITDRKTNEQRLKELARLLDLFSDSILVRDAENRITYWNQGAMDAYGYSREEVLGQNVHQLLKTVFPEPLESIQEKLLKEGRWSGELIHTRKDGSTVVDLSRWALDCNEQGYPRAVLETNTDITAHKHAED